MEGSESEKIKIVKVFDLKDSEYFNKAVNFLQEQAGFSQENAANRSKEMLFLVLDENDIVIGSCSGYPIYVEELMGTFIYYRSFISPKNRHEGISIKLFKEVREYFNSNRIYGPVELKGIYIIFENEILNNINDYITKNGLILIGFTKEKKQIRVSYFNNSKFDKK